MGDASLLIKFFALAFSALLPVINPLGSALVVLGLVGTAPPAVYRDLAFKIAVRTTLFLSVVELVGTALLEFFAGGLVLASMGWSLLNQHQAQANPDQADVDKAKLGSLEQELFYPLTFPVTAGPGCIVVTLTLSAHASVKGVLPSAMAHVGILLALVALSLLVFICYAYAPKITQSISPQTAHGILRVIAFVLLCIGVQITWNGLQVMLKTVVHS
jgi:multiple antibiotic resistance protein